MQEADRAVGDYELVVPAPGEKPAEIAEPELDEVVAWLDTEVGSFSSSSGVGLARNVSVIYGEVACWSASDFARAP